jgi:hypothetical protein
MTCQTDPFFIFFSSNITTLRGDTENFKATAKTIMLAKEPAVAQLLPNTKEKILDPPK